MAVRTKFGDAKASVSVKQRSMVRIGNSDNAEVAHKASIQNEICGVFVEGHSSKAARRRYLFAFAAVLALLAVPQKMIYSRRYYFTLRLDLAWLSFAMFNGYCRLRSAVYERLTQIGNKIWGYLCSFQRRDAGPGRTTARTWLLRGDTDTATETHSL